MLPFNHIRYVCVRHLTHINFVSNEDFPQENLQGPLLLIADVEHGVEVAVPMADGVKQHHNGQDGLGQGQHHGPQETAVGAAVDLGGLQQLLGDGGLEEGAHDNDVVHADKAGQPQGPRGVQQVQVLDQQVVGDEAAGEHHGEHQQLHDDAAAFQIRPGQGVGHQHRKDDVQQGAHHGVVDGVAVANPHVAVLEYLDVGV